MIDSERSIVTIASEQCLFWVYNVCEFSRAVPSNIVAAVILYLFCLHIEEENDDYLQHHNNSIGTTLENTNTYPKINDLGSRVDGLFLLQFFMHYLCRCILGQR